MADYYTKMSIEIEWPAKATHYAEQLAAAVDEVDFDKPEKPQGFDDEIAAAALDLAREHGFNGTGCAWETNPRAHESQEVPCVLSIYSEDNANVELLAGILQRTMMKFDLQEPISIEWSNDCSRPRIDAYGGGAVVITKDDLTWMNTGFWIAREITKLKTPRWERDDLQFPRLLAELRAIGPTTEQYVGLMRSMDLTKDQIDQLFERAESAWQKIKEEVGR